MPTTTIAEREYQPGAYTAQLSGLLGPGILGARVTLTRTPSLEARAGVVAAVTIETSDDGAAWAPVRSVTIPGGVVFAKDGAPAVESWLAFQWPGVYDGAGQRTAQRRDRVRARVTVLQSFRTAIRVESIDGAGSS